MICIIVSFVTVDTYVYISLFTTTLNFEKGCSQYIRILAESVAGGEAGKIANNNNQASIFIKYYMKDCMSKIHHGLG